MHKPAAVIRQLVFQRGRADVNVHHATVDIAACGVSVDAGTHDLLPQIGGALLAESGFKPVVAQRLVYDVVE